MRFTNLFLLAGAAAVARAQALDAETLESLGLDAEAIPVSLASKLASVSRAIEGLTEETGFLSLMDDYDGWMSTYIQTQTVMPTDIHPTATADPRLAVAFMDYTQEVARGMEELAGEKQYMDTKERQEEMEAAIGDFADVMEEAVAIVKKAMQTGEAATASPASAVQSGGAMETGAVEVPKGNGTTDAAPTQPEDESSAMSVFVNVRALGGVLAAGIVAVLAL